MKKIFTGIFMDSESISATIKDVVLVHGGSAAEVTDNIFTVVSSWVLDNHLEWFIEFMGDFLSTNTLLYLPAEIQEQPTKGEVDKFFCTFNYAQQTQLLKAFFAYRHDGEVTSGMVIDTIASETLLSQLYKAKYLALSGEPTKDFYVQSPDDEISGKDDAFLSITIGGVEHQYTYYDVSTATYDFAGKRWNIKGVELATLS